MNKPLMASAAFVLLGLQSLAGAVEVNVPATDTAPRERADASSYRYAWPSHCHRDRQPASVPLAG
ncbi:MAG: hypothetical protein IPK97_19375 [Ahniella sp.]|nr:hypothetical protein [Ahniella sp.]